MTNTLRGIKRWEEQGWGCWEREHGVGVGRVAKSSEDSEKQSYLKHSEETGGPIQLALTYRSHAVNGKDGVMDRGKERL